MILFRLLIFFSKLAFSIKSFRNKISVSNGLDPDQDRRSVGPDLGPNCLQMLLSADGKVAASKGRVMLQEKRPTRRCNLHWPRQFAHSIMLIMAFVWHS